MSNKRFNPTPCGVGRFAVYVVGARVKRILVRTSEVIEVRATERVRDGILGFFAVVFALSGGLLLMQGLESLSLWALGLYAIAVEPVSSQLAAIGALLLFFIMPLAAAWILFVFISRATADENVAILARMLIFLSLLGALPGHETVQAALPASAAIEYASSSAGLMNVIVAGLLGWLLYKAFRWLVADEHDARRNGEGAPS